VSVSRASFEARYAAQRDPWRYETSAYEHAKYERTLAAIGDERVASAFEAGCSIGVFTALLAERCDELLAADFAQAAVDAARERMAGQPHVRVERLTLPAEWPPGPFDLVVCSELLYYWDRATLASALPRIAASVAPGGLLLAVHFLPRSARDPMTGDEVHDLLRARLGLRHAGGERHERYRLDRFRA
jgi:SAM-dependent methyltransferase